MSSIKIYFAEKIGSEYIISAVMHADEKNEDIYLYIYMALHYSIESEKGKSKFENWRKEQKMLRSKVKCNKKAETARHY